MAGEDTKRVFIDTNIFIGLYESNNNKIDKIFEDISKFKNMLVFPEQVYDEFLRNRDSILQNQINLSKKNKVEIHTTSLIRHLNEFTALSDLKKQFDDKNNELITALQKIKNNATEDPVLQGFLSIYNDEQVKKLPRTSEIIQKAHTRLLIGNPPIDKRKGTMGDQIIWETLIQNLKDDLIFVTEDQTYLEHKYFIENEYMTCTTKRIIITDKISTALKEIGEHPSFELISFEMYDRRPKCMLQKNRPTDSQLIHAVVNLRNYKRWFLDIMDIYLYYEDGTEIQIEPSTNPNFDTSLEELVVTSEDSEIYCDLKEIENDFKKNISSLLKDEGYGDLDINNIDYEFVEFIDSND